LAAAHEESRALAQRCAQIEAALGATRAELDAAKADLAGAKSDFDAAIADRMQQRAALDAATSQVGLLTAERDELRTALDIALKPDPEPDPEPEAPADAGAPSSRVADGCWDLLLADLTRRWPAPLGISADDGGDDVANQLSDAFIREVERLREEVGVDAEITVTGTIAPADPVVFLLAGLDLLGALTFCCQRVVVKLDGQLDLTGEDWEGERAELDEARARAIAAGATVTPVEIDDTEVRVTLTP
jgi:hypothetical protein